MNQTKQTTYDRIAVGHRIRTQRNRLGLSREDMARYIGRTEKYYADIERGTCGMSTETMLDIARFLHVSLDYMMLGEDTETFESSDESMNVIAHLSCCDASQKEKALKLLRTFLLE